MIVTMIDKVFYDAVRDDYFRIVRMGDDGEYDIISAATVDAARVAVGVDGWFHPEELQKRIDQGTIVPVSAWKADRRMVADMEREVTA